MGDVGVMMRTHAKMKGVSGEIGREENVDVNIEKVRNRRFDSAPSYMGL